MEIRSNTRIWIRSALEISWNQQNVIVWSDFWPSQFAKPGVPFCLAHLTISVVTVQDEESHHRMEKPKQLKRLQHTEQNSQYYKVTQTI